MFNIAFNPALPVKAASPFQARGRSFAAGDSVDWRALGIDELILRDLWRAQLVVFVEASPHVEGVETPKLKRKR